MFQTIVIAVLGLAVLIAHLKDNLAGAQSLSRTIVVAIDGSGDFTSIQEAVDRAQKGDTVFIKPGVYAQDLTIHSKEGIKVVGAGADYVTLVGDGSYVGVLHIGKWPYGASDIEITGLTIHDHGGHAVGIFNARGVTLRALHVKGLLFSQQVKEMRIENCVIGESETTGVQLADSQAVLIGNVIHDNDHGVNVVGKSTVRIERNVILRNLFEAIVVEDGATVTLVGNTLVKNGSGAAFLGASRNDVSGNIVAFNKLGFVIDPSSHTMVSFNALFNREGNYMKATSPPTPAPELMSESDLVTDPLFADLDHDDYRLLPTSLLVHRGTFPYLGALPPVDRSVSNDNNYRQTNQTNRK
ncbi:MAG: pectinesterase family protein [Nitrospira sp.]|nr:pectinesterase family protein [Nitrospira sp.]